jgi:hypothetical protein
MKASEALGGDDHVAMADHRALRVPRGARRVGEHRDVVGRALLHLGFEMAGMLRVEAAPLFQHARERAQDGIVVEGEPARIVEDDPLQLGQLGLERQRLVDLLLVLGDDDRGLGVIEHVDQLGRDRILVDRHRDAAQRLRRQLREVELWAVVADNRELVATLEAECRKAEREVAHVVAIGSPVVGLPDAARLLADAGAVGILLGVALQQLGQRRGPGLVDETHARPPLLAVPR